MKRTEVLLSIIIPVYNVAPYLYTCIESCLKQDYEGYEILLIDDGSSDESGKIIDDFAKSNSDRIRVFHKKNEGVSKTRNLGISLSKGQYIWFIDADDYIESYCIKGLMNSIDGLDLLILNYERVEENDYGSRKKTNQINIIEKSNDFKAYCRKHNFNRVWNYIVRKEIILTNNLEFGDSIELAEDYIFNYFLKEYIKDYGIACSIVYYYRIRKLSASQGHPLDVKRKRFRIKNEIEIAAYIKKNRQISPHAKINHEAEKLQYTYVRSIISNSIRMGDVRFLRYIIESLKRYELYPYPVHLSEKSKSLINNLGSKLFNIPLFAILACNVYGLNKMKDQEA